MAVIYVDPAAEDSIPAQPYEIYLDLSRRPLTLGLIANAFPDAKNFMDAIEGVLNRDLPGVTLKRYQKPTVEAVSEEMLGTIVGECDGVLAAWGH
ncbi:MAG: hypothetical protein ACKVVT_02135 [Dehalococcoidia bacterium]